MRRTILLPTLLVLFSVGCNYSGTPVQFANVCDKANDDKYVEVTGFFNNSGSAMCSKSGNEPMRCPVDFNDGPQTEKPIRAYIDKGSGASSIDAEQGKALRIKDDKGEFVENANKVKIVADVTVFDAPPSDPKSAACFITIKKIEKAQ